MTLRLLTGGTFANPALPLFTPLLNGFTQRNLVDLHRLADAAVATAAKDDVTGTTTAPVSNTGTVTALSGGGARLTKNSLIQVVSAVDITQPYTFAVGLLANIASGTLTGFMGSIDYAVRGWNIYASPASPTLATPVAATFRQSIDGAQSGTALVALPAASTWTYGRGATLMVRHLGAGVGTVDVYCGNVATAPVFSQAITLDTLGEQGAVGSKTTPVKFCAGQPNWTAGDLNVEGFALWNKALTSAESIINHNAFAALASARGRAWV